MSKAYSSFPTMEPTSQYSVTQRFLLMPVSVGRYLLTNRLVNEEEEKEVPTTFTSTPLRSSKDMQLTITREKDTNLTSNDG